MASNIGYIYIRTNEYWDSYDACKLGKANNILNRESVYITSEIKRGTYASVFEIELTILDNVEKQLQEYFNEMNLHVQFNAGTEFYKKEIIGHIIPFFEENNISYKQLAKENIDDLTRIIYDKDETEDMNYINEQIANIKLNIETYNPRDYQEEIIGNSVEYFQLHNKGLLVIPCGVGKSLISLWIAQKLNVNNILIGVPNTLLLEQWKNVIIHVFEKIPYLLVKSGINNDDINEFLKKHGQKCILITTYSSSQKVYTCTQKMGFVFSMKINDECHHLTSCNMMEEDKKTYINMLKVESKKQISLTATLKLLENNSNVREDEIIVSNDNIEFFGEIIERKCLLWAIQQNIICDYNIQTLITEEENLEIHLERFQITEINDKRLFLSAYSSLLSINNNHTHHLLIYSNKKENSIKIVEYIKMLLNAEYFDIIDLYYDYYHGDLNPKKQKEIITNFENSKFGIINCVYCLGEGWDFPLLDGVVFAENMSSNIRIVQSALRASRKNKNESNKITKILLPILNIDDWSENNNSDLKKVKEIIYQMGLEDETISQKIKVFKIPICEKNPIKDKSKSHIVNDYIGIYDEDLTQNIRLKTMKRSILGISYEKAKQIISNYHIKSKEAYYELCEKDNRLSKEPEIIFKGKFTNWIDYLSIPRVYYDLETCKNKVNEYLLSEIYIKSNLLELSKICIELCNFDSNFPAHDLWIEYYDINNLNQIIYLNKSKKINILL